MLVSSPLFRRFDRTFAVRWPTTYKKVVIEWCAYEGDVFFRPHGADKRVLWHTVDVFGKRTAAEAFSDAMVLGQLRRVWPLSESEFVYWNREEGIYYRRGEDMGAAFSFPEAFRWRKEWDFLFGSCDNVCDYLSRRETTKTDFEWARLLVENEWEEWFAVKVERESPVELRRLMEALFEIYEVGGKARYSWASFGIGGELWSIERIPPTIIETLKQWFKPTYCRRRRLRGYSGWYNRGEWTAPGVQRKELSAHERLEAVLLVRDFLRDKMPPEEIEALLPQW